MTPLRTPATRAEIHYNRSQIRTRNPIERLFGVWKRRFPCIHSGLHLDIANVYPVITATAILHQIAIMRRERDYLSDDESDESSDDDDINIANNLQVNFENHPL